MELFIYDEFKWIHLVGPLLAIIAMLLLGQNMVNNEKGRHIRPLPALIVMAAAMIFHFVFGEGTLLDRLSIMLADFGIAMLLDSAFLVYHKVSAKPYVGLGIVVLIVGVSIYLVTHLVGFVWNGLKNGFSDPVEGEILLELGPDDTIQELDAVILKYDAKYEKAFPEVDLTEDQDLAQYYLVRLEESKVEDFLSDLRKDKENVDQADFNYVLSLYKPITGHVEQRHGEAYLSNDPGIGSQWWLTPEKANPVHQMLKAAKPKKKAKVAIVDTGVDGGHEDLKSIFRKSPGNSDKHSHGTHCAGLAGAATNNGVGMASFNWEGKFVEIAGYHALGPDGRGTIQSVARAITQAAEDGADVISLSLGGSHLRAPKAEVDAIKYAFKQGALVVVAAGNSNSDARYYSPANIEGVICVAAVDRRLNKAGFSNVNTKLKRPIAAPGVDIYSTLPGGSYAPKSGTSMATPIVAGVLGIMRSLNPQLDQEEAYRILKETGEEIGDQNKTGPLLNPEAAISAAMR